MGEKSPPAHLQPLTPHPIGSLALIHPKPPSHIPPRKLATALIYLLHNLIKVSARNELIESSNPPWILLSSTPAQPLPEAPWFLRQEPRQERLIPYWFSHTAFCESRSRAAPAELAEECMPKAAPSPFSGHHFFLPGNKRDARFSTMGLQAHRKEKQDSPRKPRLGASGICLCQSKAIIGPCFREEKEITYLQKHLSNQ